MQRENLGNVEFTVGPHWKLKKAEHSVVMQFVEILRNNVDLPHDRWSTTLNDIISTHPYYIKRSGDERAKPRRKLLVFLNQQTAAQLLSDGTVLFSNVFTKNLFYYLSQYPDLRIQIHSRRPVGHLGHLRLLQEQRQSTNLSQLTRCTVRARPDFRRVMSRRTSTKMTTWRLTRLYPVNVDSTYYEIIFPFNCLTCNVTLLSGYISWLFISGRARTVSPAPHDWGYYCLTPQREIDEEYYQPVGATEADNLVVTASALTPPSRASGVGSETVQLVFVLVMNVPLILFHYRFGGEYSIYSVRRRGYWRCHDYHHNNCNNNDGFFNAVQACYTPDTTATRPVHAGSGHTCSFAFDIIIINN